jgi:hypothetical protein
MRLGARSPELGVRSGEDEARSAEEGARRKAEVPTDETVCDANTDEVRDERQV